MRWTATGKASGETSATQRKPSSLKAVWDSGQATKLTYDELFAAGQLAGMEWNMNRRLDAFEDEVECGAVAKHDRTKRQAAADHSLSAALKLYLALHDKGTQAVFIRDATLPIKAVIETIGDLPLQAYTRAHARTVCDGLVSRIKTK